eukprot:3781371-Karenia_brevis.AAC.1
MSRQPAHGHNCVIAQHADDDVDGDDEAEHGEGHDDDGAQDDGDDDDDAFDDDDSDGDADDDA